MATQKEIELLLNGKITEEKDALLKFIENNAAIFNFSFLDLNGSRKKLLEKLFSCISSEEERDCHKDCLTAVRILCRDKNDLDNLIEISHLDLMKNCAVSQENFDYQIQIEGLKCLCNIIYNSRVAAAHCSKNGTLEGVVDRLRSYSRLKNLPLDIKLFDMKILFLITALCEETRFKLKEELHGLKYLTEVLESLSANSNEKELSKEEAKFACEVLKVLFNLTAAQKETIDEEEESHCRQLVVILRDLLILKVDDANIKLELVENIINLMVNMPVCTYHLLYRPVTDDEKMPKNLQLEGQDMRAVYQILSLLESKFSSQITLKHQTDMLAPILTVLLKCASSDKYLRKYLRQKILPPLRDVHTRPEEGNTLRNNLCRLLTTPITNIRDLAADLLFISCKENVARMIKYTGYGNAAGLFANRGLLGGSRHGECRDYSSESEDSDTEEYREHKHGINPVLGCYEEPRPDPMANMTEEQKEYEAMKLVDLLDNLTKTGVIHPCKISEDGRPEPIEHVLQLQDGLPAQQVRQNLDEDD